MTQMKSLKAAIILAGTLALQARGDTFGTGENTFTIDFVKIGNAYNLYDPAPGVGEYSGAVFFDPNKPGGEGYWLYATGTDTAPVPVASGTAPNTAVSGETNRAPASVYEAGGLSPYGTMGQTGNVQQWTEVFYFSPGLSQGLRGSPVELLGTVSEIDVAGCSPGGVVGHDDRLPCGEWVHAGGPGAGSGFVGGDAGARRRLGLSLQETQRINALIRSIGPLFRSHVHHISCVWKRRE